MNPVKPGPDDAERGPYRFGDVVVDPAAHSLLRAGVEQPVEPKAFGVLLALLERPGELIGRDDLIDRVWGHQHVTPGVLTRVIAQLRHALDDDPHQPRYIQTRHALGYCFIGQLQVESESEVTVDVKAAQEAAQNQTEPRQPLPHVPDAPAQSQAAAHWITDHGHDSRFQWKSKLPWLLVIVLATAAVVVWIQRERGSGVSAPGDASIAVMPFTSLSSNRKDDYFAQGLTEEMRNALAGVKGLKVAAAIMPAVRKTAADAKALGARLGVATILDASVRREGQRIRVSARLSDTRTGFTLWSHTYDRKLSGIFATQSAIANAVVHALLGAVPGEDSALVKRLTPTHNAAAFDTYLQGLYLLRHSAQAGALDKAAARFGQALKQDSTFARAQAKICRLEVWNFETGHSAGAFDNARSACQRAAQMDPTQGEVELALGDLYRARGDLVRALAYYRSSAKTLTDRAQAHVGMAQTYAAQGRHDLALGQFRQALELSPGDADVYARIGYQHYLDGHVVQAVASYRKAVQLQPDNAEMWGTLGALNMEAGNNADAARALHRSIAIQPDAAALSNLGLLKYQAGDYPAAVALQRRATRLDPKDFIYWGNLGDALRSDPAASPVEVHDAFQQAAMRVEHYLKLKPEDARAVAALGTYRAILGDPQGARAMVRQSEALGSQPGEVALLNAETLGLVGDLEQAHKRIVSARAHGIADTVISSNSTFRRLGLLTPPGTAGTPGQTRSTASHPHMRHSPGE